MSKNKKQPWDEKWKQPKNSFIGGGGQGETHKVEPKTDEFPSSQYVLKILKQDKDPERRARMYREVAVLKTLKHQGIPRLIDSNVDEFESEVKLYMVTEFIEGMTLEETIENATMELEDAINFLLKLLEIVNYCHKRDIVHRDIKPDNIILRNDDINNPVLIDFGISFNKVDLEETSLTPTGQQLGNRFLYLPEQKINSSAQRSPISDITQCCGILFFAITGENPVSLTDHEGKMPHQRKGVRERLSGFYSDLLGKIYPIFSRSFQTEILHRWSSVDELKDALLNVLNPPANSQNAIIAEIKNLFSIPENERRKLFEMRAQEIATIIYETIFVVKKELNGQLDLDLRNILTAGYMTSKFKPKPKLDWKYLEFSVQYGISQEYNSKKFNPLIKGCLKGSEIVLLAELKPKRTRTIRNMMKLNGEEIDEEEDIELSRTLLNEEPNRPFLSQQVEKFYYEGVKKMLEQNEEVND